MPQPHVDHWQVSLYPLPELIRAERRRKARFPVHEELSYQVRTGRRSLAGAGSCVNISSSGILFTTSEELPVGRSVEISMNWPALLEGGCPLKFIAVGPVIRSEKGRAAMRIDRYEFRTRSTLPRLEVVPNAAPRR